MKGAPVEGGRRRESWGRLRHPPVCPGVGLSDLQGLLSDQLNVPSSDICHVFWAVHAAVHPMMGGKSAATLQGT